MRDQVRSSFIEGANPVGDHYNDEQLVKMLEDVNQLTYAVERFPVELPQGMAHALIQKIMTHLPSHARKRRQGAV